MYSQIISNLHNPSVLEVLLQEHELSCMAKLIKTKFQDKRDTSCIKNIIREEYKIPVKIFKTPIKNNIKI